MTFKTTDLCDSHAERLQVAEPIFSDFGGTLSFCGPVSTGRCFEDNSLVRAAFETPGEGRVLVVDDGGSLRCALIGDRLAALAADHGWAGAIVYGCTRDCADIAHIAFGLKAFATHPRRSRKRGEGERDVPVSFAGVTISPGQHVYADEDGIVISAGPLTG